MASRSAPAEWTLKQVVCFWDSGDPERDGREGYPGSCSVHMQQLLKIGVKTRLQAQTMLTDHLCQSLEPTYGISRDVRRHLLDLLGVEWRQQLWSASEVLLWEQWPVEPTALDEDSDDEGPSGLRRQETKESHDIMIELGQWEYVNILEDDIKYMFLATPTTRNLLYCFVRR